MKEKLSIPHTLQIIEALPGIYSSIFNYGGFFNWIIRSKKEQILEVVQEKVTDINMGQISTPEELEMTVAYLKKFPYLTSLTYEGIAGSQNKEFSALSDLSDYLPATVSVFSLGVYVREDTPEEMEYLQDFMKILRKLLTNNPQRRIWNCCLVSEKYLRLILADLVENKLPYRKFECGVLTPNSGVEGALPPWGRNEELAKKIYAEFD